jgi:molybdopterin molybdotransferase
LSLVHSGTRKVPHLGLPGNPVSAMVTCEIFARPAIMKMMGKTKLDNIVIDAEMEDGIVSDDGRTIFARVTLRKKDGKILAKSSGPQGSGILTSMIIADGLAVIPEERKRVKPGDTVKVIIPDWNYGNIYV